MGSVLAGLAAGQYTVAARDLVAAGASGCRARMLSSDRACWGGQNRPEVESAAIAKHGGGSSCAEARASRQNRRRPVLDRGPVASRERALGTLLIDRHAMRIRRIAAGRRVSAAGCFPPPPPAPVVVSAVLASAPPYRPRQCQQAIFSSMSAMTHDVLHAIMTGGVRAAAGIRRPNAASRRQVSDDTILDFVDIGDEGAGHDDPPPRVPATGSIRTYVPPTTVPAECRGCGRIQNAHEPASVRAGTDAVR